VAEGGGRRHIVNLNHGVDRSTPVANFEAYVRAVRGEPDVQAGRDHLLR
jgi:uroporphyrinogen decarboxylase